MPRGVVHSKCSKRLLGKSYSHVHRHMDAPAQGLLKWRHRIIRHNPFIHPFYYSAKHKSIRAGVACLQHIIQDHLTVFLLWVILLLVSDKAGFFKEVLVTSIFVMLVISFMNFLFELAWMTPQTIVKKTFKLLKKAIN